MPTSDHAGLPELLRMLSLPRSSAERAILRAVTRHDGADPVESVIQEVAREVERRGRAEPLRCLIVLMLAVSLAAGCAHAVREIQARVHWHRADASLVASSDEVVSGW